MDRFSNELHILHSLKSVCKEKLTEKNILNQKKVEKFICLFPSDDDHKGQRILRYAKTTAARTIYHRKSYMTELSKSVLNGQITANKILQAVRELKKNKGKG